MTVSPPIAARSDQGVSYQSSFRRCGKTACSKCSNGPGHGPYWYAKWREGGRVRSRYIGRELPEHKDPEPFRVVTLGSLSVHRSDGQELTTNGRVRELFTLLLSAPYGSIGREEIADTIWPDLDPVAAQQNLRVTVSSLRKHLGDADYVRMRGLALVLALPSGSRDDHMFEAIAREGLATDRTESMDRAIALYTGTFLAEDVYSDWTIYRRQVLANLYRQVIMARLDRGTMAPERQIDLLRELLHVNRLDEAVTERLMRVLAHTGRRTEAIQLYVTLRKTLSDELAVEPSASLRALSRELADA